MSRTQTCLAVVGALDRRMCTAPINRVKVTDLCRDVGISRATFYEYFADVFDVAVWMWNYLVEPTLLQMGRTLGCREAYLAMLEALASHRRFFVHADRTDGRFVGQPTVYQHESRVVLALFEGLFAKKAGRDAGRDERLELEFYALGVSYATKAWLDDPTGTAADDLARVFVDAMPACLRSVLGS